MDRHTKTVDRVGERFSEVTAHRTPDLRSSPPHLSLHRIIAYLSNIAMLYATAQKFRASRRRLRDRCREEVVVWAHAAVVEQVPEGAVIVTVSPAIEHEPPDVITGVVLALVVAVIANVPS